MKLAMIASFAANLPKDEQGRDSPDLLVSMGKAITETVRVKLMECGYSCNEVKPHNPHAWEFEAGGDKIRMVCVVAPVGEWWELQLWEKIGPIRWLTGDERGDPLAQYVVNCLDQILATDKRFSKILWRRHEVDEAKGRTKARQNGVRTFATFAADLPEDEQWDDAGNLVVPGGNEAMETIREKLIDAGYSCDEINQHSFYGWAFHVSQGKMRVFCVIQAIDDWWWLVQFEQKVGLLGWLVGGRDVDTFGQFLDRVHEILTTTKGFSNVLWYTREDYEASREGASVPR